MSSDIPNPLHALHETAGAEFQSYAGLEIVSTFGDPEAEYAAIRKGCALLDLPQRGLLELTGKDRLSFLNNLLTNQTWDKGAKAGLAAGRGMYAFFLNTKGRIVADMNVLERGERTLLEMDVRLVRPVLAAFEKFLFAEQVKLSDRIGSLHEIALHGPGALAVLNEATGSSIGELEPLASVANRLFDADVTAWRDDVTGASGYHLIVPAAHIQRVWTELVTRFQGVAGHRPLRPAGWAALNATRIEAGRPIFDIDFGNSANPDQSTLPAETGQLDRAVSFTKGCYLGQEIVARMHARGQVARQLAGVKLDDDSLPVAGAPVFDPAAKENQVGIVTSSTISPVLSGAAIALAQLKKPFFAPGTRLTIPAEGALRAATVVELPFVP